MKRKIAVIGASGITGQALRVLLNKEEQDFEVLFYTSRRSEGKRFYYKGRKYYAQTLCKEAVKRVDIALFCVEENVSKVFVPLFADKGAICIDNSSYFRLCEEVPLVVPEINATEITETNRIIANPNCTTIQLVLPLSVVDNLFGLQRVVVSTYQAVSGAGKTALMQLQQERTKEGRQGAEKEKQVFPHAIYDNCFPQIGNFDEQGNTGEERKIALESRKILKLPHLQVCCTAVRIPVSLGHGASAYCVCRENINIEQLKKALASQKGIIAYDGGRYATPVDVRGDLSAHVGRLRKGEEENSLLFWVCADNLVRGAVGNMWQTAKYLMEKNYV